MPSKFISKLGTTLKKTRFAYKKALFSAGFKSPITLSDFNQEKMPLLNRYLKVNPELISKVNKVQEIAGVRLDISSGYRTPKYTKFLQSLGYAAEPNSVHMFREGGSTGVDIALRTTQINQLKLARIGKSLGLDIEDLRLTPYHVHMELPTKGSPTKLWNPKHGSNNKPLNKIVGHHPGRMNKWVEDVLDSDFTAGMSYNKSNNQISISRSLDKIATFSITGAAIGAIYGAAKKDDNISVGEGAKRGAIIGAGFATFGLLGGLYAKNKFVASNTLNSKTNGLVNNVLHNKKINHTIANTNKKVAHLFKR